MSVSVVIRVVLAGVFAVSGVAKLRDRSGTTQAFRDFGVPAKAVGASALLLPLGELVIAALLLLPATAGWGALASVVLIAAFTVAVAVALLQRKRIACHCFGQLSSQEVGRATLARNLLLLAAAGFVVAAERNWGSLGGTSLASSRRALAWTAGVEFVVLFGGLWFGWQLFMQQGRMLMRLDALEGAGDAHGRARLAPAFELPDLSGRIRTLRDLTRSGKPLVLVFSDPSCGPCNLLMPEVAAWQRGLRDSLSVAVVSTGAAAVNAEKSIEHGLTDVLIQPDTQVADAFAAHGTPTAVLVEPDGRVGGGPVGGADAIRTLVAEVARRPHSRNGLAEPNGHVHQLSVGDAAPDIELPSLGGESVNLRNFRGSKTLLLFWSPRCGFCQTMLGELKQWERTRSAGDPGLLVISTGSVEENEAMGLTSPVLLEPSFSLGYRFGLGGTPSGILIDADGKVASGPAVGASAILELAVDGVPREATLGALV